MRKIIPRGTHPPTRKVQNLTTAYDDQESMVIRILEGDRMMSSDNSVLGELELTGIPRAPRHVPIIEVSFDLDVCLTSLKDMAVIYVSGIIDTSC